MRALLKDPKNDPNQVVKLAVTLEKVISLNVLINKSLPEESLRFLKTEP